MKIRTFLLTLTAVATLHVGAADWIDVTSKYIKNPTFSGNDITTGWTGTVFGAANPMENAEHYNKTYDTWQRIDNPMKGRYRLSLNAFYRMGSAANDFSLYQTGEYENFQHAKLYVQQSEVYLGETAIVPASSAALEQSLGGQSARVGSWMDEGYKYIPNNMYAAYLWFNAGYYNNELEFTINDSSLPIYIGIYKNTTIQEDWTCLDDWKLEWWGDMVYVSSINLSKTSANMVVGERLQLSATVLPSNAIINSVEWSSNNSEVASVTADGKITALSTGQATITAWAVDGSNKMASCTVTVTNNDATSGSIVITEIQSANIDQILDPSWNYGGWVELYNPTSTGVSLKGCWLSDDAENLCKAHITQPMAIPAKGYLNLWFDHHDKYCESQVNMKLEVEGDTIFISDPNGKLLAMQAYPPAVSRCSYARKTLSGDEWGWSSTPTPEASNSGMKYATTQLAAPVVDQPSQVFSSQLTVCVNIPQGATLRYTTNGRTPTETNSEISTTGLFYPSVTTRYRFRLFADGKLPSPVTTRTYIYKDKDFSLPIISVVGNGYDLFGDDYGIFAKGNGNGRPGNGQSSPCNWNMDWDRAANFEYIDNKQMAINQEVLIERCGGWSRAWAPYAFKLKANKLLEGQNTLPYQFFADKPYLKHKTLQIRNGGNDTSCRIKDPALQEIIARSGLNIDYQAYQPVMHYLNGSYAGVINMREPNNKHFVYANYGLDDDEIDQFEMSPDSGYIQKCGTYESMQRWKDLAAECGTSDEAYEELCKMVDIDEYCNYMAIQFYLSNWDWPQNNVKGWKPIMEGGKFRFVLFDLDGSFNNDGSFANFESKQTYTFDKLYGEPYEYITKEIEFVTVFLDMLNNEKFRRQFIDSYCLITGSVFEPTRCQSIINELASRVYNSQIINTEFYGVGTSPWGTANDLIGKLSSSRQTTMMNVMKNYSRMQLSNATPQKVTLSTNLPEARLTVNGLPVPTNKFSGQLFAPVTFGTDAPAGYKFVGWKMLEGSNLEKNFLIPEESQWLYYDKGSLDGTNWQSADYDASSWSSGKAPLGYFVGGERYTNTYLDYGGNTSNKYPTYYFRKTINLTEAPSESDIFTLNYIIDDGLIIYVNGTEAGRYNMPSGDVSFNTMATTYAHDNPDSGSLTLPTSLFHSGSNTIAVEVHNNAANSTDAYWEASITQSVPKGDYASTEQTMEMPEGDMTLVAVYETMTDEERQQAGLSSAPVIINEVSAGNSIYINEYGKKDDWIELYNTTDQDIDLEGMFLTDRSAKPEKYTITGTGANGGKASTIIPAHGYKIIWCSKRDTKTQLHANFKLDNEDGTVIRLMAKDRSWADSLVYCAHNGDQTFGRYPDGGTQTYLMHLPTIDKSNRIDSYTSTWKYTPEQDPETSLRSLASRSAGMSIAYSGELLLIKSEDSQNVTVCVYTPSGALVLRQPLQLVESVHERVSVATLPAGIYVARATDSEGNECATKFIKH